MADAAQNWGDFDPQPILADGAVRLRPLVADDWDALFAVASDPEIWAVHPAHDRWQGDIFRAFFDDALAKGGALAITETATGRIIGSSRYDRLRCRDGEVEIGWTFLERAHWGGATNRAVKRLMIGYAFRHFTSAIFLVGEENGRSRRAMEKIGGRLIDGRDENFVMAGVASRHVVFSVNQPLP